MACLFRQPAAETMGKLQLSPGTSPFRLMMIRRAWSDIEMYKDPNYNPLYFPDSLSTYLKKLQLTTMWHPHYWHSYRETFPEAPGPQVNGRPDMALAADTANAQGQAAASTTAGGRGDIPRRMGYHSYAWNEHYYRRRGRGGRRLIWVSYAVLSLVLGEV